MSELVAASPSASPAASADYTPFSLDAEQALLGAILFENEVFFRVDSFLKAEHFYDPVHAMIYGAMEKLIRDGRLASPVILKTYLQEETAFNDVGGEEYLISLAANVPSTVGAHDYARVIFDLSVNRGLINLGSEMIERARSADLDDDPQEQLASAEASLYSLADKGRFGTGFRSFRSALTEAIEQTHAAYQRGGKLAGISTGLKDLDAKLGGLHKSDLLILAGRPSMGKTALATNIAVNVARSYVPEIQPNGLTKAKEGGVVGFFSLEMADMQLASRILADVSGISSYKLRQGDITEADFDKISEAAAEIENMPLHIDHSGGLNISQVAARARRLKRQHGLDLLVIDYLQLLAGKKKAGDNRVQELTEITTGLKALAKDLNIPIIALSQLSRQVEQRDDKKPQLADLRESGSIEQDADAVLFVYREEYYHSRAEPNQDDAAKYSEWKAREAKITGLAEVIIGKQRHGPIDTVRLAFDASRTKFDNLADPDRYAAPSLE